MRTTPEHTKLIEKCLSKEANEGEIRSLENLLASDPVLKSEYLLEKGVQDEIKQFRKNQLKGRLSQLPTPSLHTTPWHLNPKFMVPIISTITIAMLSGIGYYLYQNDQNDTIDASNFVALNDTYNIAIESPFAKDVISDIPTMPLPRISSDVALNASKIDSHYTNNANALSASSNANSDFAMNNNANSTADHVAEAGNYEIVKPGHTNASFSSEENIALSEDNLPKMIERKYTTDSDIYTDVENISDSKYGSHYKFEEGKLTLFGDFDNIPYRIIEVNLNNQQTEIILIHKRKYYHLNKKRNAITKLRAIKSDKKIEEIEKAIQ
ncbi:hypothetical protein [Aureibacter tunicatorum]|uniref:Uncharacterized protein n=1 Tax=Aureibacter tunicatorum TaxID=866807 RepID=A0AAE3XL40_9BACT|nr:hypothetical protein [Aureibacter tunicatorum]MDR6239856.1 hypothetical protein [Aureibacter tunicatorum]BDD04331.1 hypothetical protein AUTU_18140 [Aureibacter tunicatorum]